MPGPNVKCFLSISSLNMHRNPLRNKCIVNSSHYMNEETEKFSSLPGKWALDIDYLTSGPLTPPLTLRRTECEGRGGLERWQSRMSCVWSKGMLAAITSNLWNVSSLNDRSFFLLSHITSKWQWGMVRTRDEKLVLRFLGGCRLCHC